jgi:probable phosphoglycerate mutase
VTRLLLVRHGLTDAVGRTLAGVAPGIHLNAVGRSQAAAVADAFATVPLAAVISSPLERAVETATPIADRHRLQIELAPDLTEFCTGDWTGARFSELDADREWQRFNTVRSLTRAPRGESMLDVQRRAVDTLLALGRRFEHRTIAAVSHGDVIRAALVYFLGMPLDFYHRIDVAPGRISAVDVSEDGVVVRSVNGDSAPPAA